MVESKLDLYELNIDGVTYWKRTIHPETKEVIFVILFHKEIM